MGFQERQYRDESGGGGEGGGFKRAFRRIFVEGDNFFSWAIPFYRLGGIAVRIHIFYLVYIISRLIWPISPGVTGFLYSAYFIASGFLFVLLHEYGHCIACRRVGGEADEIVMWPLGGLAMCRPPHNWRANLITTVCGPAVNLAIAAILGGVMLGLGAGPRVLLFNLFDMWSGVGVVPWLTDDFTRWKMLLFAAYAANVYMFVFNVFLPMFPMDGGRILQELLWRKMGYKHATRIATMVGLVLAISLGIFAAVQNLSILFSICFFCGLTCWVERRRLEFVQEDMDQFGYDFSRGYKGMPDEPRPTPRSETAKYKAAAAKQERARADQAEVDRILSKIATQGMGSLSRRERSTLERATERQRGG